ncbi:MAG: glutamyl-Q tRNA(Asp) synthetase [Porticoccaceae bacterium]
MTTPVGRFAPSPTGDLHFGSLLAAMASYCDTKSQYGLWLLRMDDIDGPRSVPGSADVIQQTLEQYGFSWDGPVQWQSKRVDRYQHAVAELVARQRVFACKCSRRTLPLGKIYPGSCRVNTVAIKSPPTDYYRADHSLRCTLSGQLKFTDAVQGVQNIILEKDVGDIIIWRRDNLVAYVLACAVDDAENVSHVVRGADLLGNTAAQIAIMQALDLPVPRYAHIPVAIDANGDKLSKHSKAQSLASMQPLPMLLSAWQVLGQAELQATSITDFWKQAITNWQTPCVPGVQCVST